MMVQHGSGQFSLHSLPYHVQDKREEYQNIEFLAKLIELKIFLA